MDGFNLYYGARQLCGRGTPGWRWLDLRSLATRLVSARQDWPSSRIERVVYCTATIDQVTNPSGHTDQQTYLKALRASGSADEIAYGHYVSRVKYAPLAIRDSSQQPALVRSGWPVTIQDAAGNTVPDATFMVSYRNREEKGSDVNVASHLLIDIFKSRIDAAVVISNDSDLSYPLAEARTLVPIGTVNPSPSHLGRALQGTANDGVGAHWWRRLTAPDCCASQLPDPVVGTRAVYARPSDW